MVMAKAAITNLCSKCFRSYAKRIQLTSWTVPPGMLMSKLSLELYPKVFFGITAPKLVNTRLKCRWRWRIEVKPCVDDKKRLIDLVHFKVFSIKALVVTLNPDSHFCALCSETLPWWYVWNVQDDQEPDCNRHAPDNKE